MSCLDALTSCFKKCCGENSREHDAFATDVPSFQSTYTVRRISSFGQTVINEKGEENEIERHASILVDNSVPWTSKPVPIQTGVSQIDIKSQLEKLPTINEVPVKPKHRWKKKEDSKKTKNHPENITLKAIRPLDESNQEMKASGIKRSEIISSSHENLFSKCKKRSSDLTGSFIGSESYLGVPNISKSHSTPDLAENETRGVSKVEPASAGPLLRRLEKNDTPALVQPNQEKKEEAEKLAREYGLDLSLYTKEALKESIKSVVTSPNIQTWAEEPVGTMVVSVNFNTLQKMLSVTIISINSLVGKGPEKENFPTIVKLILIGSKKIVKTSKKIEEQWQSSVNQSFTFLIKDMDFRSMRILVYNADWQGKNDAVAYGLLSLQHLLDKNANLNIKLYSQPNFGSDIGMMQITFGYDGMLFTVRVDKIFNYDLKIRNWKVYTKIAYYSLSKKVKESHSNLVWSDKGENELTFDHCAKFKVDDSGRKHQYIVITLKRGDSHGMFSSDKSLGRVILGPSYYYEGGRRLTPWGLAIANSQEYCFSFKIYS